jgi:Tol biopolymer transport system component
MSISHCQERPYARAGERIKPVIDRTFTGRRQRPGRPFHPSSRKAVMPSFTRFLRPAAPRVARQAAIHSRSEEADMFRVLSTLAVIVIAYLAAGVSPALAAFPGHNGKIAFTSDRDGPDPDIWTMRPNGSHPVNLTASSAGEDAFPNWRADGRKIVFMSDRETPSNPTPVGFPGPDFEIFVMDAEGSHQKQITFNELDDEQPAWSPDGRRIAFQRDIDPIRGEVNFDILTMKADGTGETNLTNSPAVLFDRQPSWSPDGRKIAWSSDRGGDFPDIYTMNPNGSNVRRLTFTYDDEEYPDWSPDGRQIAFNSDRDGNYEIYAMRARGGNETRLTFNDVGDGLPAWSPNGRELVFARDPGSGIPDVFTMRADGSNQVNRTNNPAVDFAADWQPLDHHHGDDADDD